MWFFLIKIFWFLKDCKLYKQSPVFVPLFKKKQPQKLFNTFATSSAFTYQEVLQLWQIRFFLFIYFALNQTVWKASHKLARPIRCVGWKLWEWRAFSGQRQCLCLPMELAYSDTRENYIIVKIHFRTFMIKKTTKNTASVFHYCTSYEMNPLSFVNVCAH